MIVETVRLIRQGLESQKYGVNYQIQEVPRFSEDDRPRPVMGFLDPYTHGSLLIVLPSPFRCGGRQ